MLLFLSLGAGEGSPEAIQVWFYRIIIYLPCCFSLRFLLFPRHRSFQDLQMRRARTRVVAKDLSTRHRFRNPTPQAFFQRSRFICEGHCLSDCKGAELRVHNRRIPPPRSLHLGRRLPLSVSVSPAWASASLAHPAGLYYRNWLRSLAICNALRKEANMQAAVSNSRW